MARVSLQGADGRQQLDASLDNLRNVGKTILVTSHDADVYDSRAVDHVIGISDGRLAAVGA